MKQPLLPRLAMLPQNKESRDRLKELQHQLVIKRLEGLLMSAQAGEITGLVVLVENAELSSTDDASHYLWLDGSYRTNPQEAHSALLQGASELFSKIITTAAEDQLRLDLK